MVVRIWRQLTEIIQSEQAGLTVFLFAHSMGSFLAQNFMRAHGNKINGVILCAATGRGGRELYAGVALTKLIASAAAPATAAK